MAALSAAFPQLRVQFHRSLQAAAAGTSSNLVLCGACAGLARHQLSGKTVV
jgi:hypothetical protein